MRSHTTMLILAATTGIALISCARVSVHKVPSPTQYFVNGKNEWTREMQQAADKMEGFRFYLPRPFINVFESFPITTDIYLASGRVSPDGRFIAIDSIIPLSTADDFGSISPQNVSTLPASMMIPQRWIYRPGAMVRSNQDASTPRGRPRAGLEPGDTGLSPEAIAKIQEAIEASRENAADAAKQSSEAKEAATDASKSAGDAKQSAQQTTGQNRRNVTNDNGAFAYQPLRGNFDLLYLPDFDEQYVVSSQSGLGNAEFKMNLGQGWSLQGFNSFTDNSALTKRVFDVIDTGLELGKAAARAAALAAGVPLPGAARSALEPPEPGQAFDEAAGTPVALKIVVVHYAAKGLYPVIKPRELVSARPSAIVIDLAAPGGATPARAGQVNAAAAIEMQAHIEKRSTVPVYPYQYVSFNTFRYMAIEALTPQGAPFGTLYDKTGTTGEPGDRRGEDPTPSSPEPKQGDSVALSAAIKAIEADATAAANDAIAEALKTAPPAQRPTVTSVTLEPAKADSGRIVSGAVRWTGLEDAMPDSLKIVVKDALSKLIANSKDITSQNGGQPMSVSPSMGFVRDAGATPVPETVPTTLEESLIKLQPQALAAAIAANASQPTSPPSTPATIDAVVLSLATRNDTPGGRVWEARVSNSGQLSEEQQRKIIDAIGKVINDDPHVKRLNGNAMLPMGSAVFNS
jgi:hypothetical protein